MWTLGSLAQSHGPRRVPASVVSAWAASGASAISNATRSFMGLQDERPSLNFSIAHRRVDIAATSRGIVCCMRVVAHAVRSGIAALNVVTAALDCDPRTRELEVIF